VRPSQGWQPHSAKPTPTAAAAFRLLHHGHAAWVPCQTCREADRQQALELMIIVRWESLVRLGSGNQGRAAPPGIMRGGANEYDIEFQAARIVRRFMAL
jgi:hypothetical protein